MKALLLLLLLAVNTADACINIDGVTLDGTYETVEGASPMIHLRQRLQMLPSETSEEILQWQRHRRQNGDLEMSEAVLDILHGNYRESIGKLKAIEEKEPGRYDTASNLGTAYELAGDNVEALHWIDEGIQRNKYSHSGSEWLHKLILEVKITLDSQPDYLADRHILPIETLRVRNTHYTIEIAGVTRSAVELRRELEYQLGERMLFVKPKDAIVADLLYSFAILEANAHVLEPAVGLLEMAREYGYHDSVDIDTKIAQYQKVIDGTLKISRRDIIQAALGMLFWSGALAMMYSVAYVLYRMIRIRSANLQEREIIKSHEVDPPGPTS